MKNCGKNDAPPTLVWVKKKNKIFCLISILSQKVVFGSQIHGVCVGGVGRESHFFFSVFSFQPVLLCQGI